MARFRRNRRADQLRHGSGCVQSASRILRRQGAAWRETGRAAGRAAGQIRARHQPENRQGARPDRAIDPADAGRRGDRMRRRQFIALLGGAMAAAPAVHAQPKAMPVIGFLIGVSPGPHAPFVAAFHQGLGEAGYVEGQNLAIEYRWAEGRFDRLPELAADLVGRKVDLIAAISGLSARAAKDGTSTIPIVFAVGTDPVEDGLVTSLARPGGNVTGVSFLVVELNPKRFELLSELVPQAGVIALLVNPNSPSADRITAEVREAARAQRVQLHILKASTEGEIDAAFATLVQL